MNQPAPCDLSLVGHLVGADESLVHGEIRVLDGRIAAVLDHVSDGPADSRIDVGDAVLLPGAVDAHVHCLSHPAEGIAAATSSAAAGGVTTIVEMPYDDGRPVNSPSVLEDKRRAVAEQAHVDVALLATVRPVGGAPDVGPLVEAGACGFKVSLFDTHAERFPRIPDHELLDVFAAIAATGRAVSVHAENDEIIKPRIEQARQEGRVDPLAHAWSRPPVSETTAVLKALEVAQATGARVHLAHLSLPRSVALVRWYAAQGLAATVETCPHYLAFCDDDVAVQAGRLKINPPLRSAADRAAMWELLESGDIDVLASDHAPWPPEQKDHDAIFDNHSGAPGVETLLPVALGVGTQGPRLSWGRLTSALSRRPAEIFGLGHRKGALEPGFDADIVAVDVSEPVTIDERNLHSNAGWSPYHGLTVGGRVAMTISRGEVVWDGERVLSRPGRGRFVEPAASV